MNIAQTFQVTALLLCAMVCCSTRAQQQVVLDKPIRAGELIVFPGVSDPETYYYVSDKPHLSMDATGRPQFSFLRYVQNAASAPDQPDSREGDGGGIVHAVVALSVTRDQLDGAQRELQRLKPTAKIVGPVIFKSGRFGLVSSFRETNGVLTRQVVGLGNAPILDGEKAAVSIQLTKQGAKILWESFQTPTPDITFSFEMQLEGYLSPKRALLEADFEQIYEHSGFAAGLASTYLAAEIRGAFDDLQRSGAIRLTQVGSDEKLEALISTAYNKISEMMFSPLNGTGTPSLDALAGTAAGTPSVLDRATTMLSQGRQEARQENERIRRQNQELVDRQSQDEQNRRNREQVRSARPGGGTNTTPGEVARPGGTNSPSAGDGPNIAATSRAQGASGPSQTDVSGLERMPSSSPSTNAPQSETSVPQFAIVAVYEMKRVHQTGKFRIDLNKFTPDNLTLRFDENIGDLRSLMREEGFFRSVNLDDPFYRQREISVFLDGINGQDFNQFVNFVTVQLRKRHANNVESNEEIRIDRSNYNTTGNAFKLVYGWKGDQNRTRWLEYDYKVNWSFFGGIKVTNDWQATTEAAIALTPPFTRQSIDIQGDAAALTAAQVRLVQVRLFDRLNGPAQSRQVTLNPSVKTADRIDLVLPRGQTEYDYEINWQLRGNRLATSGRQTGNRTTLLVDELPNQ
jgi:hypothetical protein